MIDGRYVTSYDSKAWGDDLSPMIGQRIKFSIGLTRVQANDKFLLLQLAHNEPDIPELNVRIGLASGSADFRGGHRLAERTSHRRPLSAAL